MLEKNINYTETSKALAREQRINSEKGLSANLKLIFNQFSKVHEHCQSLSVLGSTDRLSYLSRIIFYVVNDEKADLQLPVRLFQELIIELEKRKSNYFQREFSVDIMQLKIDIKEYLQRRASPTEGTVLTKALSILQNTDPENIHYSYHRNEHVNKLTEAYSQLPAKLQQEIKTKLETNRDHLDVLVQSYRAHLLFCKLSDTNKMIFLVHDYLAVKSTHKDSPALVKLFEKSIISLESNSIARLNEIENEVNKLENNLKALKVIRNYINILKKPKTRAAQDGWSDRIKRIQEDLYYKVYKHFKSLISEKLSELGDSKEEFKNDFINKITAVIEILNWLPQLKINIYGEYFFIEEMIKHSQSKEDLIRNLNLFIKDRNQQLRQIVKTSMKAAS